jgi:hypothetical protein
VEGEPIITNVKQMPYEIPRPRNHVEAKPYEPLQETPYFREPTLAESLAAAWQTTKVIAVITPHIVKLIIGLAMKSWKTTLGAIIAGLAGILQVLGIVVIPTDVQIGILTVCMFIIGRFAADDKTSE